MGLYHIEWQTKGPFIGFLGQGIHWEHFWSGSMKFGNVLCYICEINRKVISKNNQFSADLTVNDYYETCGAKQGQSHNSK